jgi:crotonobetainyl-CoA:carnitine CoA-transferase CaiB-like acyl-CoA transferase
MMEQSNRGKRSVGIDLGNPEGLRVLHRLVESADVFLTNFLPAARRRLRIDVDDIRAVNPSIIYARGHGHGVRGPYVEKGGYDAASFWSRGGIAHVRRRGADRRSCSARRWRLGCRDDHGGRHRAALFHRERTGKATVVDVSLLGMPMVLAPDIACEVHRPGDAGLRAHAGANPIVTATGRRTSAGSS